MKVLNIAYIVGDRGHDLTVNHGYRIHVLKILEHLEKKGHNVFLIHINDKKRLPDFTNYLCIPHRYLPVIHRFFPYTGILDSVAILMGIIRLNRRVRFDVIHERYGLYTYGGVLAAKLLRVPLLLEVNAPLIEEKQFFTEPLKACQKYSAAVSARVCFTFSDKIVAVSRVLKEMLVATWRIHGDKIKVIPNAYDSSLFTEPVGNGGIRQKYNVSHAFVITFVGTFQPWYGIKHLIDAFSIIIKEIPHAKLLLVGDGILKGDLKIQAEKLGIGRNILFPGYIGHNLIPEILAVTDVAVTPVLPSALGFYNSPIKLFEYMAAGKAIVASDTGQIGEILEHEKTALLVTPGSVRELADSITRLYEEPNLMKSLGANARIEAQKYTWDTYTDTLIDMYQELIRNGSLRRKG